MSCTLSLRGNGRTNIECAPLRRHFAQLIQGVTEINAGVLFGTPCIDICDQPCKKVLWGNIFKIEFLIILYSLGVLVYKSFGIFEISSLII